MIQLNPIHLRKIIIFKMKKKFQMEKENNTMPAQA